MGIAEGMYRQILRRESRKFEHEGTGYLEWGGPLTEVEDWRYQHWYQP